jgi:hypothetical protein
MHPLLVFVHINKTAGTTVRYILRSSYGGRHCDVEPWEGPWVKAPFSAPDLHRTRKIYPHLASIAGHRITGYTDLQQPGLEFTYFTFLRDPISMTASRFQYRLDHRKRSDLSFEEWINKDWVRNAQTQRIAGTPDASDAIAVIERKEMFVGLTECFDESMVLLNALRARDLDINYARVNVAKKSTVAKELLSNPVAREMMVEANQADLELYRYVRQELYPSFQEDYGNSLDAAVATYRSTSGNGFNKRNPVLHRLKQHTLHKPLLQLYRARTTGRAIDTLLR